MVRTSVVVDERLLARLRRIARRENKSLAEVIRQALELRASAGQARLKFVGAGASEGPDKDTATRAGEVQFEPRSWR